MADLLPISLVEMLIEVERDLLARRRTYAAQQATGRLPSAVAKHRLEVTAAILEMLRAQASPGVLETLAARRQEKLARRKRRHEAKMARQDQLVPPASAALPPS